MSLLRQSAVAYLRYSDIIQLFLHPLALPLDNHFRQVDSQLPLLHSRLPQSHCTHHIGCKLKQPQDKMVVEKLKWPMFTIELPPFMTARIMQLTQVVPYKQP